VNASVTHKQQKEQALTPQEQFTGKDLTGLGHVGLLRRFFEKRKLCKELETVSVPVSVGDASPGGQTIEF